MICVATRHIHVVIFKMLTLPKLPIMHKLINKYLFVCRTGSKSLSYADAMETCLKTGPQRLKKFARASRSVI